MFYINTAPHRGGNLKMVRAARRPIICHANPFVLIIFVSPAPADCIQATTGKRVAASAPDHSKLSATQNKADEMFSEPTIPRGTHSVDVQAVSVAWKQPIN